MTVTALARELKCAGGLHTARADLSNTVCFSSKFDTLLVLCHATFALIYLFRGSRIGSVHCAETQ